MKRLMPIALVIALAAGAPGIGGATQTEFPIVFYGSADDGDINLYELTGDGSNLIIDNPGHDCGPAISALGELAFLSARQSGEVGGDPLGFDLYLQRGPSEAAIRLTHTTVTAVSPTWSPDGHWLAYSADTSLWKVNVSTQPFEYVQLVEHTGGQYVLTSAWHPDGTMIAYTVPGDGIYLVDAADGSPIGDGPLIAGGVGPDWHPDGKQIAYGVYGGLGAGDDIWLADFDPVTATVSSERLLVGGPDAEFNPRFSPDGSQLAFVRDPDGAAIPLPVRLPNGQTPDVWVGGPAPSQVWVLGESTARTTDAVGASSPTFAPFAGWWS